MPTLLMILATVLWGSTYVFIKIAVQEISALDFILFRFLVASVCTLPILPFIRKQLNFVDIMRGVKLGILLGITIFFQSVGLKTIPASICAFLSGFSVVFVLIIELIVSKSKLRFLDVFVTLICLLGLALVTGSQGFAWEAGVFYTLICAVVIAFYFYGLSYYAEGKNTLVITIFQFIAIAALAIIIHLFSGKSLHIPQQKSTWVAIISCGVLCSVVGTLMQIHAQKHLGPFKASLILTLEPVFATLLSCITLGEVLNFKFYIGAAMILVALFFISIRVEHIEEKLHPDEVK